MRDQAERSSSAQLTRAVSKERVEGEQGRPNSMFLNTWCD